MREFRAKTAAILILRYANFYLFYAGLFVHFVIFDDPDSCYGFVKTFDSRIFDRVVKMEITVQCDFILTFDIIFTSSLKS